MDTYEVQVPVSTSFGDAPAVPQLDNSGSFPA